MLVKLIEKFLKELRILFCINAGTSAVMVRSRQRYKRIFLTSISSLAVRFINILTGLITVPVTLAYLGVDRFGMWMTLTGFVAFLAFTDFGLGIGLQNALTRCFGENNCKDSGSYISATMAMMLFLAICLCVFAVFLLPCIPLTAIVKVNSIGAQKELLPTAQAFILTFAIGLPCGLIQRVLTAYQEGFLVNILLIIGRILSLIGIYISIWLKLSLPCLVLIYSGAPFLILGLSSLYFFCLKTKWNIRFTHFKLNHLVEISKTGIFALGAQVGATIMISGPVVILANKYGTSAIVPFTVTQRMIGAAGVLLAVLLAPLWPAYGEALARGDIDWVKKTFKRSLTLAAYIALPVFFAIAIFGLNIIEFWIDNNKATPSWSLLMACNFWSLLHAWNSICSMFLNGINKMKGQGIYGIFLSVLAISFGNYIACRSSIEIVIWVIVLCGETLRGGLLGCETYRYFRRLDNLKSCLRRL